MDMAARVSVEVTAVPVLSYALAHNGIVVVSQLVLTGHGEPVRHASVHVGVRDAAGPIGEAVELFADIDPGHTTVLTDVGLRLDPAAMLQVEERRPGWLSVLVEKDSEVLGRARVPVQVLAAAQWLATPLELAMEMLAAHVLPNHPSITALVAEAAEVLRTQTGSPSIQGYQSGAERVDAVASAICAAVQARDVRYSEPPASWADAGQKVRTPGEVLDERVGTCLDLVVVLAAALEQAGIRPLLWLVEGHAFLGYWREELSAQSSATTDVASLVNLVDLGLIRLVETTMLTTRAQSAHSEPVGFDELHRPSYAAWLTGDLDRVIGVVDVYRARRDGVLPLPARTRDADGTVQVVEYRPAVHSTPARPADAGTAAEHEARELAPPRIAQWKNALLDLSLRNRLINYTPRAGIALTVPDAQLGALEDLVNGGTPLTLLPSDQLAAVQRERGLRSARELPQEQLTELLLDRRGLYVDVPESSYLTRMRAMAYKAKTVLEETGANNLYLALGSLAWELDGRPLRSPLILVPVVLKAHSRSGAYRLTVDESGTSTPNYCLLEKLRQLHGLSVPGLAEPTEDGAGIDLDAALQAMRIALVEQGLPYRVEPTADLAILAFAKFRLWKDLDEHWATLSENPLVAHLVHSPTDPFDDPVAADGSVDLDELAAGVPVPADASQLTAVAEAAAGRTFVLEGPPGTGKSQTITNLLARAVADGKRVLFVAEKRAALDVVARRLDAVGMGPFALDLHDKGSRPAVVRAQIRAALEHAVQVDEQGLAADGEDLRSARRSLARYATRLHEQNAAGLSLYSAHTGVLSVGDSVPPLPVSPAAVGGLTADDVTAVRRALAGLPDVADLARPRPGHPWGFVDVADIDVPAAATAAAAVDAAAAELLGSARLAPVLAAVRTPGDLIGLARVLDGPPVDLAVLDETRSARWRNDTAALSADVATFCVAPGVDGATPAALDLPLAEISAAGEAATQSGFFGRKKRLIAVRDSLAPVLTGEVAPKAVPALASALLAAQTAARALAARAAAIPGLQVPSDWNPLTDPGLVDREVDWLRLAGAVVEGGDGFPGALRALLAQGPATNPSAAAAVGRAQEAVQQLLTACRSTPEQLAAWAGTDGLFARWQATRAERAVTSPGVPSLRRWLDLVAAVEPLRAAGLGEGRSALLSGAVPADDAVRSFELGLAGAAMTEREEATGLAAFDAPVHERAISRFTAASRAVRRHLTAALPASVVSARSFDVTARGGRVGALQRELNRQRGGLGVRGLIAEYGELVTAVMPCVLVSPDSVARFFPARAGLFDLVVFDEASQIRVADAVGALGRAHAAVVVGDSKQMPPTSFAEPTTDDDALPEDLATAVEDEESILSECVQARVPRQWLSWHYRSQDESLIAFSNGQYYENRLSSFPAPVHGPASSAPDGRGVSLVRVDGTFHRSGAGKLLRTNPVEAEAIVAEIRRRFALSPDEPPSIGVVTFNAQQRALIDALLRDAGDERLVEALDRTDGEGLFVKNLENVQGDERDVVLFSTAFSANDRGQLPLNFGPLNKAGGERRLNVAITRARRQVVVFSSFDPADLRAEQTSSVGIKHLRAYLDLAAHGTDALPRDARFASLPDRHRDDVAAALRARGLIVRTDVGLSEFKVDLAVSLASAPDVPVLAVLLDGPAWARRRTVGDRDGLPVEVLGGMLRWPAVERVWLPAWLADQEAVVERLVAAAQTPVAPPPAAEPLPIQPVAPEPAPTSAAAPEPVAVKSSATVLDCEEPFVPWTPEPAGERSLLDQLGNRRVAERVGRVLQAGAEAEGPIHLDRLARLTAGAFGLGRVAQARKDALAALVFASVRVGDFVWPAGLDRSSWTGFRRDPAATRPMEQVAPEEIGNAMVALCRASAGMTKDELFAQTLEVFGYRRRTAAQIAVLESALVAATSAGRLTATASGLLTA
ncbi:DNA helicase [Modestobacter caceresii]|uniref:DNA helicase n=1 Tax=Modestobacter caceresii TaxID=1522368 RepID=A0A098Y483_9ACTN|nr:DNA helicase [Modestobacter caceresii]